MKVTVTPIVIDVLGTFTKGWLKGLENLEIRGQVDTITTRAVERSEKYWDESWRLEETCCHSNSTKKQSANAASKNS